MPSADQARPELEHCSDIVATRHVGPFVNDHSIQFGSRQALNERWRNGDEGTTPSQNRGRSDLVTHDESCPASPLFMNAHPVRELSFDLSRKRAAGAPRAPESNGCSRNTNAINADPQTP